MEEEIKEIKEILYLIISHMDYHGNLRLGIDEIDRLYKKATKLKESK